MHKPTTPAQPAALSPQPSRLAQSQAAHDDALQLLASILARLARRGCLDAEADVVVDALVTIGYDDSDDANGYLAQIERGAE